MPVHHPVRNAPDHSSMVGDGYELRNPGPDQHCCAKLVRETGYPPLFASLLCSRGVHDGAEAARYLWPRLTELPDPFLMRGMEQAVSLVLRAMSWPEPVCIHGDYDVDGISSSALLARFFRAINVPTLCYQPERMSEGYGLQPSFIRANAPARGSRLLITVDCGISAADEIRMARELGFTVIVTDHHEAPALLPEADAVINPKQPGCLFPFKDLSGAGVAFFLALGIRNRLVSQGVLSQSKAPNMKQFLDLAALGTVADVMPVTGVNRLLVRAGLEVMDTAPAPWVSSLKAFVPNLKEIRAEDISYRFAPRLNAAGRIDTPEISFRLLSGDDHEETLRLAGLLDELNTRRRAMEQEALEEIIPVCGNREHGNAPGLVVHGAFHPGIIGILAARLVDLYGKPAVVLTANVTGPEPVRGSGRTVPGTNIYELLLSCRETLIRFGGHPMAAGLTLKREKIDQFREAFYRAAAKMPRERIQPLVVDHVVRTEELFDEQFLKLYDLLQPFGQDNPEPVFLLDNPEIEKIDRLREHLTFRVRAGNRSVRAIGFGMGDRHEILRDPQARVAVKLKKNFFRGTERTELHVVSITMTSKGRAQRFIRQGR